MGTWGTAISDNDTYQDVHAEFFSLYNKGMSVEDISMQLMNDYKELMDDASEPDAHAFWFALAQAQWECKCLDPGVLERVRTIITGGSDLEAWHVHDRARRKTALDEFFSRISVERSKAKPRRKVTPPLFQRGDCVCFQLDNGLYGGVVILESLMGDAETPSLNLAAATRITQPNKPILEDFLHAEVLVTNFQFDNDRQALQSVDWLFPRGQRKVKASIEVVGRLNVVYRYSPSKNYGSPQPMDVWFETTRMYLPLQLASEATKPRYEHQKFIRDLVQKERWTYW